MGGHRHIGYEAVFDDFPDRQNADGEHLLTKEEGKVLVLLRYLPGGIPDRQRVFLTRPGQLGLIG